MSVTVVTANFKTPELTTECVQSFRSFYPDVPYILIDNGGDLVSLAACRKLVGDNTLLISNSKNVGHGRALNQGIALAVTPYVFTLDSDTKTEKGGFLEEMLAMFDEDWSLFAVGWLRYVNDSGVACTNQSGERGRAYVHPFASLLNVEKFRACKPYNDRGAPAVETMVSAVKKGFTLRDYPIRDYIWHKVAGTRGRFAGNYHPKTDTDPRPWSRRGI